MQEQQTQEEELFVVVKDLKDATPLGLSFGLGSCGTCGQCGHCASGDEK